ncbi:hypothetical protein Tdes44962_MAKER02763 [Teratosphaeria destructans]|uniref:Uncharacterized protein n=1 Tax=Teratosphaeria destructans TaxID=418781 RepID=A0A9W7W2W9_9PEZI|nr:hypothetical protein Tdes44962_MAKER02763 [Teratosphaeria destructans]
MKLPSLLLALCTLLAHTAADNEDIPEDLYWRCQTVKKGVRDYTVGNDRTWHIGTDHDKLGKTPTPGTFQTGFNGVTCVSLVTDTDITTFKQLCTQRCVPKHPEFVCGPTQSLCKN